MLEFIIQALIVFILVTYAILLYRLRQKGNFMRSAVIAIFLSGTVLYYIAFSHEPVVEGPVTIFIRSMFDSIKLFFFEQELLEVEHIQEEPFFLDAFHLVYAAAMLTTVYAVINIFAKRLKAEFILATNPDRLYKHVFFGTDPNSVHLASLIKDESIAFIEYPDRNDEGKASIGQIFHRMTSKSPKQNNLESENIDVLRASKTLSEVTNGEGVLKKLGLGAMHKHVSDKTCFYLLSDDVEENSVCIRILESDPFFKDKTIHVNQKQDGLTQQYEMLLSPTGAHFIYPSALAANMLARDASCHPISVMDIPRDENMCAWGYASGIDALVVGFGRIGQAVTRFLYEYMAIPGGDGKEAPCHIYIQDTNMDAIKGSFISSAPGAAHGKKLIYEQSIAGSGFFWDRLAERIDKISYIVFSTPNDSLNIRLASEVLSFAATHRKNGLAKFKIFVFAHHLDAERKSMVTFFNRRYSSGNLIRTFGESEKIFTTNMIISDYVIGLDNESVLGARYFIERYFKIADITADSWDHHAEKTKAAKLASDYSTIFKEKRKLSQYASRYYFIPTIMALSSGYLNFEEIPDKVLENLARCEHYRYVASMEMAGYSYAPQNDELRMLNDRMVSWDDLPEEKKTYYKKIVQASLTD